MACSLALLIQGLEKGCTHEDAAMYIPDQEKEETSISRALLTVLASFLVSESMQAIKEHRQIIKLRNFEMGRADEYK
jgi:hypothetical protein